jgi:Transposase IS116/IS110/IS902 family
LEQLLEELEALHRRVVRVALRIGELTVDQREVIARLCTLPGVDLTTATTILAEIGTDMRRFAGARHLASWAGLCPGNAESAGQRFSGRTRKGNRYLRRMLVQNAWAVAHRKDCGLTALFSRVAAHAGMKKAAVAVAPRILMLAYYIIRDGTEYREVGGDYYDRHHPLKTAQRLTRRLERIGFEVTLKPHDLPPKPAPQPRRRRTPPPGQPCKQCLGNPVHPRQTARCGGADRAISLIIQRSAGYEFRRNGPLRVATTGDETRREVTGQCGFRRRCAAHLAESPGFAVSLVSKAMRLQATPGCACYRIGGICG